MSKNKVKLSIAIPLWDDMPNGKFFIDRCLRSISMQTFTDYEVVMTNEGTMPENTNAAIRKSKGTIIKILYQDDYLYHPNALKEIVDAWQSTWLVTGCIHDDQTNIGNVHFPLFSPQEIMQGINTIGSPSVLAIPNCNALYFDEKMTWMLDCDYYLRMSKEYGKPTILNDINVAIGIGAHQTTNTLSQVRKNAEHKYLLEKHS